MKKLITILLILAMAIGLVACNEKSESITNEEQEKLSSEIQEEENENIMEFESKEIDFSNVTYEVSQLDRDVKLEDAITKTLKYDKETNGVIRYYYNKVDLNGDQKPETFVYLVGPYVSGSGGSTAMIFEDSEAGYKLVSRFSLVRNPIIVSDNMTEGWNNLIMPVSGGGIEPFYAQMKFDGNKYPGNPSVQPKIEEGTVVKGKAIIADDISKNPGIEIQ